MAVEYLDAVERGRIIAEGIEADLLAAQENRPRTKQSHQRILGMSEMGGCREYIRATIAGDPKQTWPIYNGAAEFGTALGDYIERTVAAAHPESVELQHRLTVFLEVAGQRISVSGSSDIIYVDGNGDLVDLKSKSKASLAYALREGPSYKNKAQLAGYLVAGVQEGLFDPETVVGHLMFFDRSWETKGFYPWSMTYPQALAILESVSERMEDVARALAAGPGHHATRDENMPSCYRLKCPFFSQCWPNDEYLPSAKIEHPAAVAAAEEFIRIREEKKLAEGALEAVREMLEGVNGVAPSGHIFKWSTISRRDGGTYDRLDVYDPR